jgi:hypothetical protein
MVKKLINEEDIKTVKSSLYYKIFDIYKKNNKCYYLDNDYNLIWDENKDVVGIINKKEFLFFSDIENMLNMTDNEMKRLLNIIG